MHIFIIVLVFIFGVCLGSFINALAFRLHQSKKIINDRSICPHCQHILSWLDLVPIFSFIFLKGRCRYCSKKISWQYPLVEIITGLLFVCIFISILKQYNYEVSVLISHLLIIKLLVYWLLTVFLVVIFIYDLKYYLILDKISIPAIIIAFLFQSLSIYFNFRPDTQALIYHYQLLVLSVIIGGGFFWLQFVISRGRWIGGGDIRLGILIGLILVWPGVLIALFLSYILGALVGVGLIFARRKKIKSEIPFGTFLTFSTFVVLLWGQNILSWYFRIIGYDFYI